jgi:chemotaxis protein MotA
MNITFILGSIIFWGIIAYAMLSSAGFASFINLVSIIIVIFGTLSTIIMSYTGYELKNILKSLFVAIKAPDYSNVAVVERLILYSGIVKQGGILDVQTDHAEEENEFLKIVMQDLIDSISIEEIEIKYESYLEALEERHNRNISAFENMGGIAGAMGMIGTLIGLVAMLLKMDDPAAIGPAMAVALLTTFYGALIGNGFANAIATILKNLHSSEENQKRLILKGINLISNSVMPNTVRGTLVSMLPSDQKKLVDI